MNLPLFKNDITTIVRSQKPVIYSRNLQSGFVTGSLEISVVVTVGVSRKWAEFGQRLRVGKTQSRKLLIKRGESHLSAARFFGRFIAINLF
jgi:hypothetical protein